MLPIVVTCYLLFGFGNNALLAFFALIVLLLGFALLWRPGETPILLFVFGYQWLQASLATFYGNWLGVNVEQVSEVSGGTEFASELCLAGLLFLAAGMRLGAGRPCAAEIQVARRTAQEQSQIRFFLLYGTALIIATVAQSLATVIPSLNQPLLALANFKWAAFFILSFVTFVRRDSSRVLWFMVFLLEFAMSLGGYFSSFKFVFMFTLAALITSQIRLSLQKGLIGLCCGVVLVALGLVWTAVKTDYRSFLNSGTGSQAVTVDYGQSVEKLVDLVFSLDGKKLGDAENELITRISDVDYFGAVLNYVPSVVPHENGAIWLDAITRPLMPRLFFPDKEIIDDSAMTNKYSGLNVAGREEGTTITIGYMGESYIDFGVFGMMGPIFVLGLILGGIYRWLMLHPSSRGIVGLGLSTAVLMTTASYLENSAASMVGAITVSVLVTWLLISYAMPIFLRSVRR